MKDRNVACIYYVCEHECLKGREGTFSHYCQKCDKYQPQKTAARVHKNLRKEKLDAIKTREFKRGIYDT